MTRLYPRGYLVVTEGKIEKVVVRNPVQETAVILKHPEATGTMKPEEPDFSYLEIEDEKGSGEK